MAAAEATALARTLPSLRLSTTMGLSAPRGGGTRDTARLRPRLPDGNTNQRSGATTHASRRAPTAAPAAAPWEKETLPSEEETLPLESAIEAVALLSLVTAMGSRSVQCRRSPPEAS